MREVFIAYDVNNDRHEISVYHIPSKNKYAVVHKCEKRTIEKVYKNTYPVAKMYYEDIVNSIR